MLRVDIDQPMYGQDLAPGALYAVPANLVYRLSAPSADTTFLLIKVGSDNRGRCLAQVAQDDRRPFLTTLRPSEPPRVDGVVDKQFENYAPGYTRVDVIAKTSSLRLLILGLGDFRCVPWHTHDDVTDTFFCLERPMRVEVSGPVDTYVLLPGQTCEVEANRAHFVSGTQGNPCTFLVMQGIGTYNYVPFDFR
jgi:mannose-6-phosphate isomerase-like protein (cupin superfamily)